MFKSIFSSGIRSVYSVSDHPTFKSEPWSIYPAKKNSSGKVVSVFIFDKKLFESNVQQYISNSHLPKNSKVIIQECYELIKFEINQSSKLKHPQILTIIEPLEETKLKFLFVLEPVHNNLKTVDLSKLDELTIQKGFLQISKSLQFLHNFCNIIHFNIQPSSIYINDQGDWKLFGFRFVQNLNELSIDERDNFFIMNNSSILPFTNLNLNFAPPELLLDSSNKLNLANDIWSLGCLIYYVYNKGALLIECFDNNNISDFKTAYKKFEQKSRQSNIDKRHLFKDVSPKLYGLLPQMIARYPHDRITIDQFIDSEYFNGSIIKAMWFIDEFATKSFDEKLIFLKGLLETDQSQDEQVDLLSQFPSSFRNLKFLPLLIDVILNELKVLDSNKKAENSNSENMISLALTTTLRIGNSISNLTFQDKIYNILLKNNQSFWKKAAQAAKEVSSSATSAPAPPSNSSPFKLLISCSTKVRLTLVENLQILRAKVNDKQYVELLKSLSDKVLITDAQPSVDQIKLQELFLKEVSEILPLFEFPYIKNTLLPQICQIFQTTTILSTKLATISSFENFIDEKIIDKPIVNEQLLPLLNNLKSRDKLIVNYTLNLNSKIIASEHINLDIETMVSQILPQCWNLSFGCNNCTATEFNQFIEKITGIQNLLIAKRMKQLPEKNMNEGGFESSNDFNNLIQTQKFNQGNQDQILKAPKDEVIIQPRKVSSPTTESISSVIKPRVKTPLNFNSTNNGTHVGKKTENKVLPHTPQPLSFGQVNSQKVNNDALLKTLNTSYPASKPKAAPNKSKSLMDDDDDDFNDFQTSSTSNASTNIATPASTSGGGIDWNAEINKTKPMNELRQQQPQQRQQMSPGFSLNTPYSQPLSPSMPSNNNNSSSGNYPPGFNSMSVLTPTSKH